MDITVDVKVCRICKDEKCIDDFWKNPRRRDGRYSECKKCAYEQQQKNLKKRLEIDPQYTNKRQQEWRKRGRNTLRKHLKQKYNMTLEEYDAMLLKQNGKCAICGGELGGGHRIAVDHDHGTGKIRELLHFRCNQALGFLMDSPEICMKAAEYLKKHGKV